jgi:5'-nucleotidase
VSALFLDEPTIEVVNQFEIDFNAIGNHEFDKGQYELLRMKNGGCEKHTDREPCMIDKSFQGANFKFLASNTVKADGTTLFPSFGIKAFGGIASKVRVGFIGMTLKDTPNLVTPAGVAGLQFKDEAETANALIPRLKAQGADVIVVILHQGGRTTGSFNDKSCPNLSGDILPILAKLDPAVDVVISGHTHSAYVCDYGRINTAKPFLLTSAGQYGTLVTDINLTIDTGTRKVVAKTADNLIVQGEPAVTSTGTIPLTPVYRRFTKDSSVDLLIKKYVSAAQPLAQRVVATLSAPGNARFLRLRRFMKMCSNI